MQHIYARRAGIIVATLLLAVALSVARVLVG
jgi:hypothetical protein